MPARMPFVRPRETSKVDNFIARQAKTLRNFSTSQSFNQFIEMGKSSHFPIN
jgi:hypothetical protein